MHRRGRGEIAQDLVDRPLLIARQREGQPAVERLHEGAVDRVPDPRLLLREGALARHQPDLHADELVELESLRGAPVVVVRFGTVDPPVRARPVDEPAVVEELGVERFGEASRLGLLETRGDELAELPREDFGLPRLRVHGHDRARVLADAVEDVDDRVGHLQPGPPVLDPPEEGGFGSLRQLLLAPALVEEHDAQVGRSVEDLGLDHDAALARPETADLLDLGEHRRLLAHRELGDLGPLRAVVVPARVVLEQVEDVADLHLGERRLELGAHGSQFGDRVRGELAQGQPVRSTHHLLDADEVRVQRLIALVHLDLELRVREREVLLEPGGVGRWRRPRPRGR